MALSMEEERILTEIASQLSGDDPALARRLTHFGHDPRRRRLRVRRAGVITTVAVVIAAGIAVVVILVT